MYRYRSTCARWQAGSYVRHGPTNRAMAVGELHGEFQGTSPHLGIIHTPCVRIRRQDGADRPIAWPL